MSLQRVVYLLTSNAKKLPQFQRAFGRFGITVIQSSIAATDSAAIHDLLHRTDADRAKKKGSARTRVLAVLREQTALNNFTTGERASMLDLERVKDESTLTVHYWDEKKQAVATTEYKETTEGHLDFTNRRKKLAAPALSSATPAASTTAVAATGESADVAVFGWDDLFYPVPGSPERSVHELRELGFKYTSRDIVIGRYIQDYVYYTQSVDLKWQPQSAYQRRSVDFANSVYQYCRHNKYLSPTNPWAVHHRIPNIYKSVVNSGVFFRSPKNRREKTYWFPGLNAGLPLVPKKDDVHEITFQFHDFGHFLIPDLLFTGSNSKLHRNCYIAYRMISEAVTMTLADGVFVDSIKRNPLYSSYDFSTRKIAPLLEDAGMDLSDTKNFKSTVQSLLRANVAYVLRGDDTVYRNMIAKRGKTDTNLELFKTKYMPFFVEDFRWTVKNYADLSSRANEFKYWWTNVAEPLRELGGLRLESIDDCIRGLGMDPNQPEKALDKIAADVKNGGPDLIDRVYERVYQTRLDAILSTDVAVVSENVQLHRAFVKWMIGQLAICARFGSGAFAVSSQQLSSVYVNKIKNFLLRSDPNTFTIAQVNACRSFYEQYVDSLLHQRLMTPDDAATFKEVYPLFEPFYVDYDHDVSTYQPLHELSKSVFDSPFTP